MSGLERFFQDDIERVRRDAEWATGAPGRHAEPRASLARCDYPGCEAQALRGSAGIAMWRQVMDTERTRAVLLCPAHARAWDDWLDRTYREGPGEPVLHH